MSKVEVDTARLPLLLHDLRLHHRLRLWLRLGRLRNRVLLERHQDRLVGVGVQRLHARAIAVELDLMHPAFMRGWLIHVFAELRGDEFRHRRGWFFRCRGIALRLSPP